MAGGPGHVHQPAALALTATARPNFLLLTPVCVFLGAAAARYAAPGAGSASALALILAGALLAHVSVNMLNEYEDFRSGLDSITHRTPFSGGSGTLPRSPGLARHTLAGGIVTLAGTMAIGLYFTLHLGLAILPLGLLGIAVVASYSTHIVRSPIACLVAPGVGFGLLMVTGTALVLTGHYSPTAGLASLLPFFLVSDLLLLNQFPDVDADRQAGRRHFPIVLGRRASALIYGTFLACTYATIAAAVAGGYFPPLALLGMLPALAAIPLAIAVYRHADELETLPPLLGLNVMITLATPLLVGLGLLLG